MTDPVPSKERIGFLIEYWTAKLKSHQRWPEGQGMQAELMGLIYADTITALRQMHSAHEAGQCQPIFSRAQRCGTCTACGTNFTCGARLAQPPGDGQ